MRRYRSSDTRFPVPRRRVQSLAAGLALTTLLGCASNGPPRPPSLNLPNPVTDLRAERIGDQVALSWTTSDDNTDDLPVRQPLSVEICRDPQPAAHPPAACTVVLRRPVAPGPSTALDPLPPPLRTEPVSLLAYRVRLLNAAGRSAGPSNLVLAPSGAAPPPVVDLHAVPSLAGNRLLWAPSPPGPPAAVELRRLRDLPSSPPPPTTPSTSQTAAHHPPHPPLPVHLVGAPQGPDPGGTLDASAPLDQPLHYVAWRLRTVTVAGHALALRSPDSAPLDVRFHDIAPPGTPAGLQAIVDSGSVDLSWEPATDADLAGYWIERTPAAANPTNLPWQRLNPAPLPAPAFRDTPGPGAYRYRVVAVDTSGNLSSPGTPVVVTLSPPASSAP